MHKVEVYGEVPLARFGHTICQVHKTKAVLFGGATGDTGKYIITNDTYTLDLVTYKWRKIEVAAGMKSPTPRAAHSSTAVETMQMVVYGGATGGGSLATDELFLLDLKNGDDEAQWMIVPVVGQTPGRRYGHTLIFSRPYLLVYGGNTGSEPVNDVWCLNVDRAPFSWAKLEPPGELPCVRVYHSAALCMHGNATGMMVIFGGRTADQSALNDAWGLRRHRDGRWDWVKAPYKPTTEPPKPRYQHSTTFMGAIMIVIGGRTNQVTENVFMEVYDTESSEWHKFQSMQRFRHSSWTLDYYLYVHGGFEHDNPNIPTDTITRVNTFVLFKNYPSLISKLEATFNSNSSTGTPGGDKKKDVSPTTSTRSGSADNNSSRSGTPPLGTFGKANDKSVRLSENVVIGLSVDDSGDKNSMKASGSKVMRTVTIDKYKEEVTNFGKDSFSMGIGKTFQSIDTLYNLFLNQLLRPKEWSAGLEGSPTFPFRREHIIALADECQKIVQEQPMVVRLRAPIKVFGDIHGQYQDLMRFFDLWGSPSEQNGDIESYDYLFLGDYVDRGSHSLETICLLMALKVKYPDQIHLLRGNHEDKWINNAFGFADECATRLGEDPSTLTSIFNRINEFFDWLPLAAVIDDKIICLHGGIGSTLNSVDQIDKIERPLEVVHEVMNNDQQLVVDILWSDPTDTDQDMGIQPNYIRDPNGTGNIVKFGPDRVKDFLDANGLNIIMRAHECVMDGFERFAGGALITVFSATDYCGKHKNAGAALFITRKFEIVPKLIYPLNNPEQNWITGEDPAKKRPPTPPRWTNQANRRPSFD